MAYHGPPPIPQLSKGPIAGCLCFIGSCVTGFAAFQIVHYHNDRVLRGAVIGIDHTGQFTAIISLVLLIVSIVIFGTNLRLVRWITGLGGGLLGCLCLPAVLAQRDPLLWHYQILLGSLVILMGAVWPWPFHRGSRTI